MKKLMLLGGSRYLLPVIEAAHKLGIYVITCDYLPDNIAHKYADEYCNESVIDKDAVLARARQLQIDGIMSFACDPGVVTAAYVAEKMHLPFQGSYEAVSILQDKGKFRSFLTENGFNCPHAKRYEDADAPLRDVDFFTWPVIVKPTDSAGSKGVTRVDKPEDLKSAIETALNGAHNGAFIVEDFLTFEGYHSSADLFTIDGKLKFVSFSDQLFDKEADNPYTPALIIWPTTMKQAHQDYLTREIQRLMELLHMRNGIYNIETCAGSDGKPYIMEVSPRGGGCKIAELQRLAYGVDLIEQEVKCAVGMQPDEITQTECNGTWCEMVVHAGGGEGGILDEVVFDELVARKHIKVVDLATKPGDIVSPFTGANAALGDVFVRAETREELQNLIENKERWMQIRLR